jgi:large subunit ribosomal protein L39
VKRIQNRLFDEERKRQEQLIPRIEKMQIIVKDVKPETEDVRLIMNKEISTPYDCAMHISEMYAQYPVAEVDGVLWDMHRPIPSDATVRFRQFVEDDPHLVNVVFWRSCSFLLGMVIETAFKQDHEPILHSWPKPNVRKGSFVYDAALNGLDNWRPADSELIALTSVFWKIKSKNMKFERLQVSRDLAKQMFSSNPFKSSQLDGYNADKVVLYRVGDHIDISIGPMIANTGVIGRVAVTAVHRVDRESGHSLYRFQGVGLPSTLMMNHFAFNVLLERSKELNDSGIS